MPAKSPTTAVKRERERQRERQRKRQGETERERKQHINVTSNAVLESNETSENACQVPDDGRQETDHDQRAGEAEPSAGDAGRRDEGKDDLK